MQNFENADSIRKRKTYWLYNQSYSHIYWKFPATYGEVNASQLLPHVVGKVYVRKINRRSRASPSEFRYRRHG